MTAITRRNAASDDLDARLGAVLAPTAVARGLPNEAYTSPDFARFERETLLAESWVSIGFESDVPEAGDVKPVEILGLPLLFVRDRHRSVRVFHNVCSHRGARLVREAGKARPVLRCPYHSWAYDLAGRLKATPHIGGAGKHDCPGFDRARHGLREVRSATWFGVVFVDLSGTAPSFEEHVAPLAERWKFAAISTLRRGGEDCAMEFEVACNWKLTVENYCEAYHLPWVHPGLNSYSRLEDHYEIVLGTVCAGQGSHAYRPVLTNDGARFPRFPDTPREWASRGEYVALFPNVLLGLHADHAFAIILEPVSAGKTRERIELSYLGEAAADPGLHHLRIANLEAWRVVFAEDLDIVERLQEGRESPAFDGGVFSPAMDGPTHRFHRWAADGYLRAMR